MGLYTFVMSRPRLFFILLNAIMAATVVLVRVECVQDIDVTSLVMVSIFYPFPIVNSVSFIFYSSEAQKVRKWAANQVITLFTEKRPFRERDQRVRYTIWQGIVAEINATIELNFGVRDFYSTDSLESEVTMRVEQRGDDLKGVPSQEIRGRDKILVLAQRARHNDSERCFVQELPEEVFEMEDISINELQRHSDIEVV